MPNSLFKLINEMEINPITLRFKGVREKEYREYYNSKSLPFVRLGLFVGLLIFAAYGILDYLIIENYNLNFFIVRFLIVIPFGGMILGLTYTKTFFKYTQLLTVYGVAVAGAGVIAVILMSSAPLSYSLYAGLLVLLMANYSLIKMRLEYSVITGWIIFLVYIIGARYIVNMPKEIVSNQVAFILGTNVIGMFTSYHFDFSQRRDYYYQCLLEKQKRVVDTANLQLESQISNRTKQLLATNKALKLEADIRKKEEDKRQKLEEQLFFLQRMETIGTFSGGIAHDFNNILATITGYADIIKRVPETRDETKEYIEQIELATKRAKDLINQLLTFSKELKPKFQKGKIDSILNEAIKFLKPVIKSNINLSLSIGDNLYEVLADHNQLHQVIMNLISNAQHAMRENGGILTVELKNKIVPSDDEDIHLVSLSVEDSGEGMNEETKNRMFEPYYTTKEVNIGHGLGLSMVHGIIENHNAKITVDSKLGKGTRFEIEFPACREYSIS